MAMYDNLPKQMDPMSAGWYSAMSQENPGLVNELSKSSFNPSIKGEYKISDAPRLERQTMGNGENDMTLTNKYLGALKDQQAATRAAQGLSGTTFNEPTAATMPLPGLNGLNQDQLQNLYRGLFGLSAPGTAPTGVNQASWTSDINQVGGLKALQQNTPFGSPITPYAGGGTDVTRLANNPFATTSAARDLFR